MMRMSRGQYGRLAVVLGLFALLCRPATAGAQSFGKTLDDFLRRVEEGAGNVTKIVGMEAASAIINVIANTKAAFDHSLTKTVDQLDDATTKKLREIQTLVDDFERNVHAETTDLADRAQQILSTLPFSKTTPQVRAYNPRFLAPRKFNPPVRLTVKGNFPESANPTLKPSLSIGGKRIESATIIMGDLIFELPRADLVPFIDPKTMVAFRPGERSPAPPRLESINAELVVPYEEPWLLFLKRQREMKFPLLLGRLPGGPGSITYIVGQEETPVFLRWGDQKELREGPGWRIEFVTFEGSRRAPRPGNPDRFLNVRVDGDFVTIEAPALDQIE